MAKTHSFAVTGPWSSGSRRPSSSCSRTACPALTLPCHLWPGRAFLPRGGSRRRGAMDGTLGGGWEGELGRWLGPFLARLGRKEQRRWAPFYVKALILPGERKSVEPMAARVAPGDLQQLHHFVSTS